MSELPAPAPPVHARVFLLCKTYFLHLLTYFFLQSYCQFTLLQRINICLTLFTNGFSTILYTAKNIPRYLPVPSKFYCLYLPRLYHPINRRCTDLYSFAKLFNRHIRFVHISSFPVRIISKNHSYFFIHNSSIACMKNHCRHYISVCIHWIIISTIYLYCRFTKSLCSYTYHRKIRSIPLDWNTPPFTYNLFISFSSPVSFW